MLAPGPLATSQRVPHFLGDGRIGWHERPVARPGRGELLLRVRANALCGTDRSQLARGSGVTPGHEAVGEVVQAGPDTSMPAGTLGAIYLMDVCEGCSFCRVGATNQCRAPRAWMGFDRDGGLGQFELVRESCFFPIPSELGAAEGTLLLDVMGTSGHALSRALSVRPDARSLAIGGAGPIGLGLIAMARLRFGPDLPIVVTDVVQYRLALAERLGAVPVHATTTPISDVLRRLGLDDGVDVAIDTAGRERVRRALLEALDRRGVLVCVGHGEGLELSVSEDLIAPERTIMGSEYFPYGDLAANLDLLLDHRDYLRQIITHRFGVEEVEEAYRLFLAGETGKVVVEQ
jgi:threonine 3-dehydrogenase